MVNLDPKDVLGSTGMLPDQFQQIWELSKQLTFSDEYKKCQDIIVCGMGGSAYGGYIIANLFKEELKIPLYSNNDYHLPGFANSNSLVLLSSYSGTTEEVLSCLQDAQANNFKISGITSGGELASLFKENGSGLVFDPKFNPSGQPRLGTGYMVLGTIALLARLGYLSVSDEEVKISISELKQTLESIKQQAKDLAQKFQGYIPIYFAAEFLNGNIHILRNQTNETAKSFAAFSELSELNHHLMEGLKNPTDKKLFILFINSDLYSDKLKKRVELTKDVVGKNNVLFNEYKPAGSSKLAQVLNVLSFGGYLTYYLAMLYGQDPSLIPWVDYFKAQLVKG